MQLSRLDAFHCAIQTVHTAVKERIVYFTCIRFAIHHNDAFSGALILIDYTFKEISANGKPLLKVPVASAKLVMSSTDEFKSITRSSDEAQGPSFEVTAPAEKKLALSNAKLITCTCDTRSIKGGAI